VSEQTFTEKLEAEVKHLEDELLHHQEAPPPSGPPGSPAPEPDEPVTVHATVTAGTLTPAPAPKTPSPASSTSDSLLTGRIDSLEKTVGMLDLQVTKLLRLNHLIDE
jgi:hypothetical protein